MGSVSKDRVRTTPRLRWRRHLSAPVGDRSTNGHGAGALCRPAGHCWQLHLSLSPPDRWAWIQTQGAPAAGRREVPGTGRAAGSSS